MYSLSMYKPLSNISLSPSYILLMRKQTTHQLRCMYWPHLQAQPEVLMEQLK